MRESLNSDEKYANRKIPESVNTKRPEGKPYMSKPVQGFDSQWYDAYGKRMTKDQAYSNLFFRNFSDEKLLIKIKENMKNIILDNIKNNQDFAILVSNKGIEQPDKEKLSAYRIIANGLGYDIEELTFNPRAHTVIGRINKISN